MGIGTCGPAKFHPKTFLQSGCERYSVFLGSWALLAVSPTHQDHHSCHTEREPDYETSTGEAELRDQELVVLLEHFISAWQKPELQLNSHVWIFSLVSQKIFFLFVFFLKFDFGFYHLQSRECAVITDWKWWFLEQTVQSMPSNQCLGE